MNNKKKNFRKIEISKKNLAVLVMTGMILLAFAVLVTAGGAESNPINLDKKIATSMFIGDVGDNTVKQFDANTGQFLGTFVESGLNGLNGPMGLLFSGRNLLVVNQNFGLPPGEIFRFDRNTGAFLDKLVASDNPQAPFAPRGIIQEQRKDIIYVADIGTKQNDCSNEGRIARFNRLTGEFLGDLDRSGFTKEFHPRGILFGPDGKLYVSAIGCPIPTDPKFNPLTGYILRFDPMKQRFVDIFASSDVVSDLHRPEGLAFDDDGNLWVASFRADADDSDKILKFNRKGVRIDKIVLAPPQNNGGERAFAQDILFGPKGNLFVPISGGNLNTAGQVRRYNIKTKAYDVIVPANNIGGQLQAPYYMIFDKTNPTTLAFEDN
jgi:glucose/arabinose dehydrogenase